MMVPRLLSRARSLAWALLARDARRRRDAGGCARNARRILDLAARDGGPLFPAPVERVEPIVHSRGGFFACRVICRDGGRHFAKAVLARSPEAAFWTRWREGLIRTSGAFYAIHPPSALRVADDLAILVFPALDLPDADRKARGRSFRDHADLVTRAIADFNSDHLGIGDDAFPRSRACAPLGVPSRATIRRSLGLDAAAVRDVRGQLREVEARWPAVCRRVYGAAACLSHMDLGPGNFVRDGGVALLLDFGLAGLAPVGSDLHTVARFSERLGATADHGRLVDVYAEVFAAKGAPIDRASARAALDAHFAARYRNLAQPSARKRRAFDAALRLSLELTEEAAIAPARR